MLDEEQLLKINNERLDIFSEWLRKNGVSETTAKRYIKDTSFFLNTYLVRYNKERMEETVNYLEDYFGDFFITKCMWASEKTIRSSSNSLKKFFTAMKEEEVIEDAICNKIIKELKEGVPFWQEGYLNYLSQLK